MKINSTEKWNFIRIVRGNFENFEIIFFIIVDAISNKVNMILNIGKR